MSFFTQCLSVDQNYTYALHDRASCYRILGDLDKATEDYLASLEIDQKSFMYNNLGAVYMSQNLYDQAKITFDKAVLADPKNPVSYNNRGNLHYQQKEFKKALQDFEQAIKLKSDYAIAISNRAAIHQLNEQYKAALSDLNYAYSIDQNNPSILLNRGIAKEMLRDEEGACEDWLKAGELGLKEGETYYINNCE